MAIKVTDKIVSDAYTKGLKIVDVMAKEYEGEIADKIKANDKLAKLTPLELAMVDAGLSVNSTIKSFFTDSSNTLLFPAIIDSRIAEKTAANPMLGYVCTAIETVEGSSIKGIKLDWTSTDNAKALKKRDISEGADLPVVKVTTGDKAISLYKRGVAVQTTYEALMFCKLNMFLRTIDAIAANSANQQMGDAIDVLVNGDGNNNAATVKTAASTSFAASDIVSFAVDFATANNGMAMDTIICNTTQAKALLNMTVSNTVDLGYRLGASFTFPQYDIKNITVIGDDRVPQSSSKDIIIGINRANALTKYIATGSQINEIASNIQNQTKLGTLSEIVGFSRFIDSAAMIMKLGS